jgi:hypothetical protein
MVEKIRTQSAAVGLTFEIITDCEEFRYSFDWTDAVFSARN